MRKLNPGDVEKMALSIQMRQRRFQEPLVTSLGVVLFNYGDSTVEVVCTQGEWTGTKADLTGTGLPLCPNGHPLFEGGGRQVFVLISEAEAEATDE